MIKSKSSKIPSILVTNQFHQSIVIRAENVLNDINICFSEYVFNFIQITLSMTYLAISVYYLQNSSIKNVK